ncbi:MAG: hypothetical protein SGBAC_012780 [Bacillariaceae sp.]
MATSPASAGATLPMGDSPVRGHSKAYPRDHMGIIAKIQLYFRQHSGAVLATVCFFAFCLLISSDFIHDSAPGLSAHGGEINFSGALKKGYFSTEAAVVKENVFRFTAVTDLDQLSKFEDGDKIKFRSHLLPGTLTRDPSDGTYSIDMEETREIVTGHNEAGRGAEFSELQLFNNRLLTFDDRTGEVFEIRNNANGKSSYLVPRFVVTEGEGDTDKGMKWEWATVKDDELYIGSMGKEYTRPDGTIKNKNNLWISKLDNRGSLTRIDWSSQYGFVRHHLGADSPGYLIHEAVRWSEQLHKWVFAPRRISSEKYDDEKDERNGSNKVVLVNEEFTSAETVTVKMASDDGLHGFSSFCFVPGTNDKHVLALRSVEEDCAGDDLDVCKQRSYFVVFDLISGDVLMDEVEIEKKMKFEGVEFVDLNTIPPNTD